MQELDLKLFIWINATSDTALWMIDWGRFFTWWPQLFVFGGLLTLLIRRRHYGLEWFYRMSAAVLLAICFNHVVSWIHPAALPVSMDIGQLWMKGASFASWMGDYPVFLPTIFFACFMWNKGYLFTGWVALLTLANIWGLVLIGWYFPLQIMAGIMVGVGAIGTVTVSQWIWSKMGRYTFIPQERIEPVT
ncbi:hypothetical protein [Kiloniella sp.]|uniref:hypothetical protein n=1 Tax=Kiloniella sp. TaxID=1938587 RepID=UPI003B0145AB